MKPIANALCAAALLFAGVGPAASQPAQAPSASQPADAARISVEESRQALQKKSAVVVDVRSEDAFRAGHIAGAVSLPNGGGADLESKVKEFKLSGKTVITYCS